MDFFICEFKFRSPKTDLKFGQSENVMVFQSTFSPNDALKNAEKTPVNSRNNSRDSSYSRNSSDRRKNQDRDRRTSSDKQSRSDSRDNDYSRQRTPTSYRSSRDEPRYPSRSYSSEISSRDSRHYRPESRNSEYSRSSEYLRKSRARSNSPYQNKTVIPGLNCSPNYKSGDNFCRKCLDPVSKNVLVRESLSREMGLVVRKLEEEMKRQTLDKEKGIR